MGSCAWGEFHPLTHSLHNRLYFPEFARFNSTSKTALPVRGAHSAQQTRPHARQWCRRRINVNCFSQWKQLSAALSGTHSTAAAVCLDSAVSTDTWSSERDTILGI